MKLPTKENIGIIKPCWLCKNPEFDESKKGEINVDGAVWYVCSKACALKFYYDNGLDYEFSEQILELAKDTRQFKDIEMIRLCVKEMLQFPEIFKQELEEVRNGKQ